MKKQKFLLALLVAIIAALFSCETDNDNIDNSLESTEALESRTQITVETGEKIIIPVVWGDEESAEIVNEPDNAAISTLNFPFEYIYQSEDNFSGRERVRIKITDHLEGTVRNVILIITVEPPLVGITFD